MGSKSKKVKKTEFSGDAQPADGLEGTIKDQADGQVDGLDDALEDHANGQEDASADHANGQEDALEDHADGLEDGLDDEPEEPIGEARTGPVIVGVGASAGGLDALNRFLEALPGAPEIAIIIVSHLEPHHRSRLPELLNKTSPLPVVEAIDGAEVVPGLVHVIPPNAELEIHDGHLKVVPRTESAARLNVIDRFFESLAKDADTRAMGVILSGTESDGTQGMAAIKQAGGITFAQAPKTAGYAGMPGSAIRANAVDFVLPPAELARKLCHLAEHPYVAMPPTLDTQLDQDIPNLSKVHLLLRSSTGVDFTEYKPATFKRRLLRRMALRDIDDLEAYMKILREEPAELRGLYDDALINVTEFFRESTAIAALREQVFPRLASKKREEPIRIWVAGCSTGEEVYTIAMVLADAMGDDAMRENIQIFGTDVHEANIKTARIGTYKESALDAVPDEYRRRYFTRTDEGYRVAKRVRDMCVFSIHNVYRDPPFSNIDLVSCQNVLIYFKQEAQRRALTAFHYALNGEGNLLLGTSESPGPMSDYYVPVGGYTRLFAKRDKPIPLAYSLFAPPGPSPGSRPRRHPPIKHAQEQSIRSRIDRNLIDHYVPPGVVIDQTGEVLEFLGSTSDFLQHGPGQATLNLFRLARDGLELDLRSLAMEAQNTGEPRTMRRVRWRTGKSATLLDLEAIPIPSPDGTESILVITFQPVARKEQDKDRKAPLWDADAEAAISAYEEELDRTREQLEATIEQYETSTEELRTSNEEALSINEELQSTNEELQTTAEELQSANEELTTLNEEMQNRNAQLSRANGDLENLLASVRFPIVFLGPDLRIRRFTPSAESTLRLIPADIGRPISDLRPRIGVEDLEERVAQVIRDVRPQELEIQDDRGRWFLLRIQAYRTVDNRIDGAVLVLLDIHELTEATHLLNRSTEDLRHFATFTSHELREPLRNISQITDLLVTKKWLADEGQEAFADLRKNIDRMVHLVSGILRLSAVDQQKAPHASHRLDKIVNTAESMLQSTISEYKADVALTGGKLAVWGSEPLLVDLFVNLIDNAIRHNEGKPRVEISAVEKDGRVEVRIHDNGPGFRRAGDQVFELFQPSSESKRGFAVGLALCRRIVERAGGRIWQEPSDEGATVCFSMWGYDGPNHERRKPPSTIEA